MDEALHSAWAMNEERLSQYPDSPFFLFAKRELITIADRVNSGKPLDRAFYENLNIGLMCARELEAVDMEFCNSVYTLLEEIRIRAR